MVFSRYLLFFISIIYLSSCDLDKTAKLKGNLPKANGKPGEIILVMDSAQWEGELGKTMKAVFHKAVPDIPREEPMFSLNHIRPKDFQSILKKQKNIIICTVLGDKSNGNRRLKSFFTDASLKMIRNDPALFMLAKQDEFARGQEVLHLFGETSDILIENITKNKEQLLDHFLEAEGKRFYNSVYAAKVEKGISAHIEKKLGCNLKVPFGFEIAMEGKDFIWLRSFSPDIDKNIFIASTPYTSEQMFSLDNLLKLRTELSKPYILYKPENPESYMVTETKNFDVFRNEINFKGNFAVELKGLWKINNYYMGGPFVSYAMVDATTNKFYYVEAFLYSPGKPQRDLMRELNTIIKTFDVVKKTDLSTSQNDRIP